MRSPTREQVSLAVFNLLKDVPGIKYASRRPQDWDDTTAKPAIYVGSPEEAYSYPNGTASPPIVTFDFDAFLYIDVGLDPNTIPDTVMNNLLDAIDTAMAGDASNNFVQTLGGIVNHAWVDGSVKRMPGWINGKGFALFTIRALVPWGG